jgi:hypothetical protein
MTLGTQSKAGMNDEPKLHLKCHHCPRFTHWTIGKLYPVVGDMVRNDVGGSFGTANLLRRIFSTFKLVWVWPDGTELEVLE